MDDAWPWRLSDFILFQIVYLLSSSKSYPSSSLRLNFFSVASSSTRFSSKYLRAMAAAAFPLPGVVGWSAGASKATKGCGVEEECVGSGTTGIKICDGVNFVLSMAFRSKGTRPLFLNPLAAN